MTSVLSLEVHYFPRVISTTRDIWDTNHTTPQVQLEDQELVVKEMCFRASSVPKQKTTVFKLKEANVLSLPINIHPPLLDLLEQCKGLTTASIHKSSPCPTVENNLRRMGAMFLTQCILGV